MNSERATKKSKEILAELEKTGKTPSYYIVQAIEILLRDLVDRLDHDYTAKSGGGE